MGKDEVLGNTKGLKSDKEWLTPEKLLSWGPREKSFSEKQVFKEEGIDSSVPTFGALAGKWGRPRTPDPSGGDLSGPGHGLLTERTYQVKATVMDPGPHGHPDQVAYIITWEDLVRNPPSWVKPFLHPPSPSQSTLLALEAPKNRNLDPHKPVLPDKPQRDLLLLEPLPPPPQNPLRGPPPYASPLPPVLSPALSSTASTPTLSPTSPSAPPSTPSPPPAPPKLTPRTPPPTPPRLRLRRTEDPEGPST
ncbi:uncharacterized protein [Macaca fascicularis]|uniref:uncharacterized protein n=1 Tax=Macaca fascicularis TaxID=9541 RepID=UPI003D15D803